jgi:RecA-family ATPase
MERPDYLDGEDDADFASLVGEARRKRRATERGTNGARPSGETPGVATVGLVSAASVTPAPIKWLWPGWLARGRLHILAGQPGAGKTTLGLAFAATLSRGGSWPDGARAKPASVVFWSGEDDLADTLVPRLTAAGADCSRIHFVRDVRDDGRARAFDPACDMEALQEAVRQVGDVALVVIDPVALIASKDSHKNAETRRDLQPLAELCRTTGAAALGVHHLAKGTAGREPQERLIGSIAFAAVARIVMIAAKQTATDGEPERRVLMRAKSNIGADDGGFAYSLEEAELDNHPGVFASRVRWGEPVEGTAREVLALAEQPDEERGALEEAKAFLSDLLAEGPVAAQQVRAAAEANGHAWRTLVRAKKALRIQAHKTGIGSGWTWSILKTLPKNAEQAEEGHSQEVASFEGLGALRGKPKAAGDAIRNEATSHGI